MTSPSRFGSALVLSLLVALTTPSARAEDESLKQATALFKQGLVQYRLGDFARALSQFEAALKLANRSNIILNIAQCHRQLGHDAKALFFYKLYLTMWAREKPGTTSPYQQEIDQHVKQIEEKLARVKHGDLEITSTPPGAQVWIDGQLKPGKTPLKIVGLPLGERVVELQKGTARYRGTVKVVGDKVARLAATLAEVRGQLTVHSQPSSAEILFDGKAVGRTPKDLTDLPLGQYTVELRKPHHLPVRRWVRLEDSEPMQVSVTLQAMGTIAVRSEPPGASVFVDDQLVGPAPTSHELAAGTHKVRVALANRQEQVRQVTVEPGKTAMLSVELELLPEVRQRITSRRWKLALAWVAMPLGILGGLGGAAMVVTGEQDMGRSLERYETHAVQAGMEQALADAESARRRMVGGWVVIGTSAALIVTSIYLFAAAPSRVEQPALDVAVLPRGGDGALFTVGGAF